MMPRPAGARLGAFLLLALGCAPSGVILSPEAGPPPDVASDVPGLEVAADVAVADAAPADGGADAPDVPPSSDVAVADAAPDVVSDAPRSGELVVRASIYPEARHRLMYARCSATGWGTAAGPAATLEAGFVQTGVPDPLVRVLRATVTPGAIGSMEAEGERVIAGVRATLGEPYPTAAGSRLDFDARATFRTLGTVTVTVTGCSVGN